MIEFVASLALYLAVLTALIGLTAWAIIRMKHDSGNGSSGSLGNAMLEIQSMFEPSSTHVSRSISEGEAADDQVAGIGEDPVAGRASDVVMDSGEFNDADPGSARTV
jgi:hypothetical protein